MAKRRYGKRNRYGNRYVARNTKGQFISNVDVGRSLKADKRRTAKNYKGSGYGQQGDTQKKSFFSQGYDDKMDESLGMRHRGKHSQSMKDRRDEASAMDKRHSKKHRKYDDVGTMDMNAHGEDYMDMDAHGHEEFEAQYRIRDKNGDYWYKNSKTGDFQRIS